MQVLKRSMQLYYKESWSCYCKLSAQGHRAEVCTNCKRNACNSILLDKVLIGKTIENQTRKYRSYSSKLYWKKLSWISQSLHMQKYDIDVAYVNGKHMYIPEMLSQSYLTDEKRFQTEFEHMNIISFLPICNKRLIQFCRTTDWDDLISSRTPYYRVGCLINQIFQLHWTHILIYMMRCLLKMLSYLKVTVYSFLSACRVISNLQYMHHTMNGRKYNTEI